MAWCKHITEEIDLNLQSEGPELGSGVAGDFQILVQNVVFARTHMGSFHVYFLAQVILGILLSLSGLQLFIFKMETN